MADLVADCPRCGSKKITFDITQEHYLYTKYDWQYWYEAFSVCRHCRRSTTFVLSQRVQTNHKVIHQDGLLKVPDAVNRYMDIAGYVSLKDAAAIDPPEHLPENIAAAFSEAAKCAAIGCHNAAGTMFRLCVDMATRGLLPEIETDGLNAAVSRNLGLRLPWLFSTGRLPEALRELSTCIKEDGNDGAHQGTLAKDDVHDLLDFTITLLERMYTEPQQLRIANERRAARRAKPEGT